MSKKHRNRSAGQKTASAVAEPIVRVGPRGGRTDPCPGAWGFEPNPAQLMMFALGDPDEIKDNVIKSMQIVAEQAGKDFSQYEYAIAKCNRLLTPKNEDLWTSEEMEEWKAACDEFDDQQEVEESEE